MTPLTFLSVTSVMLWANNHNGIYRIMTDDILELECSGMFYYYAIGNDGCALIMTSLTSLYR